jgi:hypothetical protein
LPLAPKAGIAGPGSACSGGGTEMKRDTSLLPCMIAYANPMRQFDFPVETEHLVCHELIRGLVERFEGPRSKTLKFDFSYEYN